MKKIFLLFILFFGINCYAENVNIVCPAASQMNPPTKGTIYANKFSATTPANIPEIGNTLLLSGEAASTKAIGFEVATWTDRTFLCHYKGDLDDIVTFETVLWQYVKRCWFKATGYSECQSTDPAVCTMTCELGQEPPL